MDMRYGRGFKVIKCADYANKEKNDERERWDSGKKDKGGPHHCV